MPCFRCGTRQADPDHGPSRWRRAVCGGRQVLVCPDCQDGESWREVLEACPECGSLDLTRRLGRTVCTLCLTLMHDGWVGDVDLAAVPDVDAALARDVAEAIERTLGRA